MSDPSDVTDVTQPTQAGNKARYAADEIRQLKAYVQGLVLGVLPNLPNGVRQTVKSGAKALVNGAMVASFFAAGAVLALNVNATATPILVSAANGWNVNGSVDKNSFISADAAGILTLPANNRSYIAYDILTGSTGTWSQTLAGPQYESIYPKNRQACLQFGGAIGSTVFLDDMGNTWAAVGGAKTQNTGGVAYPTLANYALGGAGAGNTLVPGTDYVKTTDITQLNPDGWTLRCWVDSTTTPVANGNCQGIVQCHAAGGFGVSLMIYNNAGAIKIRTTLSSTGTGADITDTVSTTAIVANTKTFIELIYDGTNYRLYIGGAQDFTVASAARICSFVDMRVGFCGDFAQNGNHYIDKFEYLPYVAHPAGTAYAVPTTPPVVGSAGYTYDWFSIDEMKMYTITGPSTAAGTAPVMAQVYRVYMGEATTTGAGFAANNPISYALNGRYHSSGNAIPGTGSRTPFSHNLGVNSEFTRTDVKVKFLTTFSGYTPGMTATPVANANNAGAAGGNITVSENINTAAIIASGNGLQVATVETGPNTYSQITAGSVTATMSIDVSRSWGMN